MMYIVGFAVHFTITGIACDCDSLSLLQAQGQLIYSNLLHHILPILPALMLNAFAAYSAQNSASRIRTGLGT